jgi:hypothetical protein
VERWNYNRSVQQRHFSSFPSAQLQISPRVGLVPSTQFKLHKAKSWLKQEGRLVIERNVILVRSAASYFEAMWFKPPHKYFLYWVRFFHLTWLLQHLIWRACSSETSADFQRTTSRYVPEYITLHNHCCENLKSRNASDLNLRGTRFECRPEHRRSWLRIFVVFLGPSTQIQGVYTKLCHKGFLPRPLQFIITTVHHPTPYISESSTTRLCKLQINK